MSNKIKTSRFDVAEHLRDEEDIAEYLAVTLEDEGMDGFLSALRTVARARGMTQLAKDTGLGRESLYKTLSPGANPKFDTIMKITNALGLSVEFTPKN